MRIKIKELTLQNFKGYKYKNINFGEKTDIFGKNDAGKSTLHDGFSWLLFNKDSSGMEKFDIRPLDADGNRIDNVEIMVEGTFEIDGKEIVLKKVQRQKWVKKRGTDITELQGNENLFEINGYPKSEKDYRSYISDLVGEELFKMITDPKAFPSLPWKKQREVLMKLTSKISDSELAIELDRIKFAVLIPELEQASTDDIKAKYSKALSEWKKIQIELPARIDEASKAIVDIDVSELELHKNSLNEQISDTEKLLDGNESQLKELDKKTSEIMQLRFEMNEIVRKENESLVSERRKMQERIDEAGRGFDRAYNCLKRCQTEIEQGKKLIEFKEDERRRLSESYLKEKEKSFEEFVELEPLTEHDLTCPTCGQELPEGKKAELISNYEERKNRHKEKYLSAKQNMEKAKEKRIASIIEDGNAVKSRIKEEQDKIGKLEKEIEECKADELKFNGIKSGAIKVISELPESVDMSGNEEYQKMGLQLSEMEESLKSMNTGADYRNQMKIKITGLREELSAVEKKIASADNSKAEERIAELQKEQKEIGQKVADQEKLLYLLEEFIRAKMNRISDSINGNFKLVNWKLFDMQINGGMKECCECTVKGVPYYPLNSAGKIQAGLDIISTLQEIYGIKAPIFIDNRESVTEIPDMDCQVINLHVSPADKELRVEIL